MTIQQLKRFQDAKPFEAFAVHLADGRFFYIRHPEAAILTGAGRTLSLINSDQLIEVVDMLLVISLRPLNQRELETRR